MELWAKPKLGAIVSKAKIRHVMKARIFVFVFLVTVISQLLFWLNTFLGGQLL